MADIPRITPSSPASAASGNTPVAPASSAQAAQPILAKVPVQQAPANISSPVTGVVISSDPQTQEIRIQTAQGEVDVQSAAVLPPGTEVSLKVYTDQAQMLADITLLRQSVSLPEELEKILQPPASSETPAALPPLKEGNKVTALQLPEQPTLPIEQIAASIETLKLVDIQKLPLSLPPQLLETLLTAPDVETVLKSLPPQQLQQISYFIASNNILLQQPVPESKPDVIRQLLTAYLPQILDRKPDITPESTASDMLDNNLLQIVRAQLSAKVTQQAIQSPAPPNEGKSPAFHATSLPPLLEVLISSADTTPAQKAPAFKTLFPQLMSDVPSPPLPENMYQLEIIRILPPQTPPQQAKAILAQIPVSKQSPVIPQLAEVEATTSSGLPILKAADSLFVIRTPASVPVGSLVIFKATPMTPQQIMTDISRQILAAPVFDPLLNTTWPALQEVLQMMPQAPPAMAQAFHNTMPTPTSQLVPTTLFFLAALRLGSVDKWLGGNVLQALQLAGKKDLAARLGGDFSKIADQSKETLADDWRSISIPLMHDDQISQMQFYVRQQHDQAHQGEEGRLKPATRFILNLHLSRMGEMQLDGYVQKKNFDMILRTEEKLPFDIRQELMKRFALGLEQVHMQGGISFQTRQQNWIIPEIKNLKNTEA